MKSLIGKSGIDWSKAPHDATHYMEDSEGHIWVCNTESFLCWGKPEYKFISKEEDLGMKSVIKGVADLPEGALVRAVDGDNGFVKDGKIVWMSNSNSRFYYYEGFAHQIWTNLSIASYSTENSFTCLYEFTLVNIESKADSKIRELEATIKLAQQQLQEYRGMK